MVILNYTTKIPVETTIAEIEKILSSNKAGKILKEYNDEGQPTAISFIVKTDNGKQIPFKLPMKEDAILKTMENQSGDYRRQESGRQVRVIPANMVNLDQARRVGWRILKDWLEAQMALYQLHMVKIEEIFLAYAYNPGTGETLYEQIEKKGFSGFTIEDKSDGKE